MFLLKEILEVTIYKFSKVENILTDVLAKLAKELTCAIDEAISINMPNHHILAPIILELINFRTIEREVTISSEDLDNG